MPRKCSREAIAQRKDVRDAIGTERQYTHRAAELELRFKDGRECEALSWALCQRRRWRIGTDEESLELLFASALVSISGHNLQRLTEMIREEKLEVIQEHDSAEATLLEVQNRPLAAAARKAIVTKILVEPAFERSAHEIRG